jgi:hypothetical protein
VEVADVELARRDVRPLVALIERVILEVSMSLLVLAVEQRLRRSVAKKPAASLES